MPLEEWFDSYQYEIVYDIGESGAKYLNLAALNKNLVRARVLLVSPDLATFAKAIANGFPMSAVAGRADVVEVTRPRNKVGCAGVYNASQVSMAASLATLQAIKSGEMQRNLNDDCVELEKRFAELAQEERVSARLLGFRGQFQVYFTDGCLGLPICDLSVPHRVRLRRGLQARSLAPVFWSPNHEEPYVTTLCECLVHHSFMTFPHGMEQQD